MRIAIIGGGMAGLGAAYEIQQSHKEHTIVIFEKAENLGGLAASLTVRDVPIEQYYHHMFPTYFDFFEVARMIGFFDKMYFRKASTAIHYKGVTYPFSSAMDLIRFTPIPFFDRIRMGLVSLYLKWQKDWEQFEQVTASTWLRKFYGDKSYEIIWRPLLVSKFGDEAEKISMVWFWSRVYERPSTFGYFVGGFKTFVDEVTAYLEKGGVVVHTSCPITSMRKTDQGFSLTSKNGTESFDRVIVAAPAEPFAHMAAGMLPDAYVSRLSTYKFMGSICVLLTLKKKLTEHYWTNINDAGAPFVALVEHTNFVDGATYGGLHPVYLSRYISTKDALYTANNESILRTFLTHLKKVIPDFSEDLIVDAHVFKAPYTQPVILPDNKKQKPSFRTPVDGLWWISMSHVYPWDRGTDHSFHFGRDLARELLS